MRPFLGGIAGALTAVVLIAATDPLALRDDGILFPDGTLQTTAAAADPRRAYYLTDSFHQGGPGASVGPLDACDADFHMASLWEILDPSNLRYDFARANAATKDDAGQGPPSGRSGWVRTGAFSWASSPAGQGNCNTWQSPFKEDHGTVVFLEPGWSIGTETRSWVAETAACDLLGRVWWVEG